MDASSGATKLGLRRPPLLLLVLVFIVLAPPTSAAAPAKASRSSTRRRRRTHAAVQLHVPPDVADRASPAPAADFKPQPGSNSQRSISQEGLGLDTANSFISLSAPVHKVATPPVTEEDIDDKARVLYDNSQNAGIPSADLGNSTPQHQKVSRSGGIDVAHAWKRSLGDFASKYSPHSPHYQSRSWEEAIIFRSPAVVIILAACVLFSYMAAFLARRVRQGIVVRSVHAKVRRANEFFLGLHGDATLCLACVEFIPSLSSNTVTFLCGHSFHIDCINEWSKRQPCCESAQTDFSTCPGYCPICAGTPEHCKSSSDCARLFALHSLSERYPGALSKEDSERLASQPSEVVQSDIQFARQQPRVSLHSIIDTIFA